MTFLFSPTEKKPANLYHSSNFNFGIDIFCSRKRSVVQYKPEESQSDKQKRLEEIKKKAQEAKEIESLSDLSEDFGDFEFEEPQNISFVDEGSMEMLVVQLLTLKFRLYLYIVVVTVSLQRNLA